MDPKYLLGIEELDSQHSEIESVLAELKEAYDDRERWLSVLDKLCEKLKFHFYAEESIMRVFAYPETLEHTRSHLEIIGMINSLKNLGPSASDIQQLKDQPMQLFFEQVLSQDMRFAAFLKRNRDRLGIQ